MAFALSTCRGVLVGQSVDQIEPERNHFVVSLGPLLIQQCSPTRTLRNDLGLLNGRKKLE